MKLSIEEFDSEVFLWLTSETGADATLLARIALCVKKEPAKITTYFDKNGETESGIVFEKKKDCKNYIG